MLRNILLLTLSLVASARSVFKLEDFALKSFDARVDNFDDQNLNTFPMRYWVNEAFWDPTSGPIFLYICGEWTCKPPMDRDFSMQVA